MKNIEFKRDGSIVVDGYKYVVDDPKVSMLCSDCGDEVQIKSVVCSSCTAGGEEATKEERDQFRKVLDDLFDLLTRYRHHEGIQGSFKKELPAHPAWQAFMDLYSEDIPF